MPSGARRYEPCVSDPFTEASPDVLGTPRLKSLPRRSGGRGSPRGAASYQRPAHACHRSGGSARPLQRWSQPRPRQPGGSTGPDPSPGVRRQRAGTQWQTSFSETSLLHRWPLPPLSLRPAARRSAGSGSDAPPEAPRAETHETLAPAGTRSSAAFPVENRPATKQACAITARCSCSSEDPCSRSGAQRARNVYYLRSSCDLPT